MADETAELLVKIMADVSGVKEGLDSVTTKVDDFGKNAKNSFSEVGQEIAKFFAAEKVAEFFKEGILEFAKLDRQMDITVATLKRLGIATGGSKTEIGEWAEAIEKSTMFTKGEALTSLNTLVNQTGNLTASYKLARLAMDVSTASGLDLATTAKALGNAFEGNTVGLRTLTIAFPHLKKVIEDGADPIAFLEGKVHGLAQKMGNQGLAGALKHMKDTWNEVAEDFAVRNQDIIRSAAEGIQILGVAFGYLVQTILKIGQTWGIVAGSVFNGLQVLYEASKGHFTVAFEMIKSSAKGASQELETIWTNGWSNVSKAGKSAGVKIGSGLASGAKKANGEISETIEATKDILDGLVKKQQMSVADMIAIVNRGEVTMRKSRNQTEAEFKKQVAEEVKIRKDAAEKMKKMAEDVSGVIMATSKMAAEEMTRQYMAGTLTIGKAFEILGKAILKSLVTAIAEALMQESIKNLIIAIGMSSNMVTAGGAGGFYATAAIEAAGAGVIQGVANAALAEGGVVTAPTTALIGEGGEPEAVVPLSKAGAFGFGEGGGDSLHIGTMSFPGVTNKQEAHQAGRTAARALFSELQTMKTRSGNRSTSF